MNYQIKLKSGFFKTLNYNLSIEDDELILRPVKRQGVDLIVIDNSEVLEIGLVRYPGNKIEFEIITSKAYHFGCISQESNMDEIVGLLKNAFGRRFSIE